MRKEFQSAVFNKCPNCLKGNFFITQNPYNLRMFDKHNKKCPECGMDFMQEPGFYFGAAIMSYVFQVAVIGILFLLFQVIVELETWPFLFIVMGTLIALVPVTFRLSRILWLILLGKGPHKNG